MDFEKLKHGMENTVIEQMKMIGEMYYNQGFEKGIECERKRVKKEIEDSVIVVNGQTYIDLEYEVKTSKHSIGMDLNSLKQNYFTRGCLIRDEKDKYIPNDEYNTFVLNDGKLFINKDEITILNHVYNIQRMITKDIYDVVKFQIDTDFKQMLTNLRNTLTIENKQKNPMFNSKEWIDEQI